MRSNQIKPHPRPYRAAANSKYAILGVATVSSATAVAIMSVPDNVQAAGALTTPAAILLVGLLIVPALCIRRNVSSLFRAEHIVMLGIGYWLLTEPIEGANFMGGISSGAVVMAFTACGLFAVGVWLGVAGKGLAPPKAITRVATLSISDTALFKSIIIAFSLGILYYAYCCNFDPNLMLASLSVDRFSAPWSRGALGGYLSFLEQLYNFGYVVPVLTVLLAHRKGWMHPHVIIGLVLSLVILAFLTQSGGRRIIGVAVGAALITWLFLQARINARMILAAATCLALLLAGMNVMLEYRKVGLGAYFDNSRQVTAQESEEKGAIKVDNNFYWFARAIQYFPHVVPYAGLQPIFYHLTLPIPRALWPGKPVDAGYDLAKMANLRGLSLTMSIIGEFYTVSGLVAVLFGGLFFGLLGGMWNNLISSPGGDGKIITLGLGLMDLFAGLRGMQDLMLMSYGLICWLVIASFIARRRAAQNAAWPNTTISDYDRERLQGRLAKPAGGGVVPPRSK